MGKTALKKRSVLAQNIVSKREAVGWNQQDLADKVGVHVNTIKSIETDKSEGDRPNRQAIADALGCTLADLYAVNPRESLTHSMAQSAPIEPELLGRAIQALQASPPARRAAVLFLLLRDKALLAELPQSLRQSLLKLGPNE